MLGIYDRREFRARVKLAGRYVRGAYESIMHHLPRDAGEPSPTTSPPEETK